MGPASPCQPPAPAKVGGPVPGAAEGRLPSAPSKLGQACGAMNVSTVSVSKWGWGICSVVLVHVLSTPRWVSQAESEQIIRMHHTHLPQKRCPARSFCTNCCVRLASRWPKEQNGIRETAPAGGTASNVPPPYGILSCKGGQHMPSRVA